MTLKSLIFALILAAISSIAGFIAGQSYKNSQAVTDLKTSIEELRNDQRALEKELAKQTGVILPANRQDIANQEGITNAEALLKQGAVSRAALYFSNAIAQEPGNWSVLQRYYQSLLNYNQQLVGKEKLDTALNLLAEMETFLRTQSIYLKLADLKLLEKSLAEIAKLRQTIMDKQLAQVRQATEQKLIPLLAKAEEILAKPNVQESVALQETLVGLQTVDTAGLSDSQITQIQEKIALLEKQQTTLESVAAQETNVSNLKALIEQTQQFIDQAKKEPSQSEFVLYYLTSAETMIRQLVLIAPDQAFVKQSVAELTQQLKETAETIANTQLKTVWAEVEQAQSQIKIDNKTKAQEALNQLISFRQFLGEKASKLASSTEFLGKTRTLVEEVDKAIEEIRKAQLHLYDQWAIQEIQDFYQSYKNELGTGTDEDVVYRGILNNLGPIDTRYLSTPAQTAYNEAFGIFYAELGNEQKIPLSGAMVSLPKAPLTNF